MRLRLRTAVLGSAGLAVLLAPCTESHGPALSGIHKIKHVVVIMQENRSFDTYFGTFPGADGIPMKDGVPIVCNPDPRTGECVKPFHDPTDRNGGGPVATNAIEIQINGGRMDGFIRAAQPDVAQPDKSRRLQQLPPERPNGLQCTGINPTCVPVDPVTVMGYHDDREIPNYWAYAKSFVLQDRMFQPSPSWSLPEHLYMVSEWSARCSRPGDAASCTNDVALPLRPETPEQSKQSGTSDFAWTDLTYLLHKNHVSWGYYVSEGTAPDCDDGAFACQARWQGAGTPSIWNPLRWFDTVRDDQELGNIRTVDQFYGAAKNGTLPAVSWVIPNFAGSEHAPSLVSDGQAYVTGLINAVMQGTDWDSTAVFLTWDDAGGHYDHVPPPAVDDNGYGLRVPGLVISSYAKKGYIDHQTLSFDAYVKFIEDDFLGGQRLDPRTDGRPDPRPRVRESATQLGDLARDFDFNQQPRRPLLLKPRPG